MFEVGDAQADEAVAAFGVGRDAGGEFAGGGEEGVQVSVEVREMERASYAKRVVARQR